MKLFEQPVLVFGKSLQGEKLREFNEKHKRDWKGRFAGLEINKTQQWGKLKGDKELVLVNDLSNYGYTGDNWEEKRPEIIEQVKINFKKTKPHSIMNHDINENITLGFESDNKPFSHVGRYEQLIVNKNIDKILPEAIYIGEIENDKHKKGYTKYEYFLKSVKIDGKDFTVKISVGVDGNGRWHYDNSTLDIKKRDLLYIVKLNYLSSQQASKFSIKDKRLNHLLQELFLENSKISKSLEVKVFGKPVKFKRNICK